MSVAVREIRGNVLYVIGKVARPGELVVGRHVDVMQVLSGRVTRLNSVHAYAESPHSRTRHFVSNVQAEPAADGLIAVKANFLVTRTRKGLTDTFIGRYEHELKADGPSFRYHRRRAILDHDALRPHGRVTIIL